MKLSIIIPLYNKEKYIKRCLESLLTQDIAPNDYEIIIVDDGSKDSGALLVEQFAEKNTNSNIHLIRQHNQGPSAARNRALKEVKGDYLYFLDADDYLAPNVLHCLLELCHQNNLEILEFDTKDIEEGALSDLLASPVENQKELAFPVMDGISYIAAHDFRNQAWRYVIHRNFLQTSGIRFIEHMQAYEDLIFTATVFLQSTRISKVNLDAHRYVLVAGSIVRSKDPKKNQEFIDGMVKAIKELRLLIQNLDISHKNYANTVMKLKAKQQAIVFALIIRVFKYRLHTWKDLRLLLVQLKTLEVYPINSKIGIGNTNPIHKLFFIPAFNSKTCLCLGLKIRRQFSFQ